MLKKLRKMLSESRGTNKAGSGRHQPRPRRSRPAIETLEDRLVPTTKLFIDFATLLPAAGPQAKVAVDQPNKPSLLNLVGPNTGPDLREKPLTMAGSADLTIKQLKLDYNGDGHIDANDIRALQSDVLPIVQRAYQPFAVDVELVSSANASQIKAKLDANNGDAAGQFDAYVLVGTFTSGGGSVIQGKSLIGQASGADLGGNGGVDAGVNNK